MTRVLVVCAAGASSTFLARRLEALASESGFDWSVTPAPVGSALVGSADIVAVTAHVATDDVLAELSAADISFLVLPETVNGGFGAEDALSTIAAFVGEDGGRTDSTDESLTTKEAR